MACSRVSARCMGPTRRHLPRSTVVPNSAARSSITSQWAPRTSNPPAEVAPIDSRLHPNRPAALGPAGETWAATATSGNGRW